MRSLLAFVAVITTIALAGCAVPEYPTEEKYKLICQSWVGANINSLVDSWGYPTREFRAPNGNSVYLYKRSKTHTTPVSTMTFQSRLTGRPEVLTMGGDVVTRSCETFFETETNGTIVKYRIEGNDCKSY